MRDCFLQTHKKYIINNHNSHILFLGINDILLKEVFYINFKGDCLDV